MAHLLLSFHFLSTLVRLCSSFFCRTLQRASSWPVATPTPLQPASCSQSPASSIRLNRALFPSRTPRSSCQKHKTVKHCPTQHLNLLLSLKLRGEIQMLDFLCVWFSTYFQWATSFSMSLCRMQLHMSFCNNILFWWACAKKQVNIHIKYKHHKTGPVSIAC